MNVFVLLVPILFLICSCGENYHLTESSQSLGPQITSPSNGEAVKAAAQIIMGNCTGDLDVELSGDIVGGPLTTSCLGGMFSFNANLTAPVGFTKNLTVSQSFPDSGLLSSQSDIALLDCSFKTTYDYTGSDQAFVISSNAFEVDIKAWGAAGGGPGSGRKGGAGAFIYGEFITGDLVSTGDSLIVKVGRGGAHSQLVTAGGWEFGGSSSVHTPPGSGFWGSSGGGLTGVFTGAGSVLETDLARAVAVAGSGGGSRTASAVNGGHGGNTANVYIMGSMRGEAGSTYGATGIGGGGAGWPGGSVLDSGNNNVAYGGGSYLHAKAKNLLNEFSSGITNSPPRTADPDWSSPVGTALPGTGGSGRVVITECRVD